MSEPTLAELKWALHCARSSLGYWRRSKRATRKLSREEGIAKAQAEVDRIEALYTAVKPVVVTKKMARENFIGPIFKRPRGTRGDGPTIVCIRCEEEKPRDEFYSRGTVCRACFVKRAGEWAANNKEKSLAMKKAWEARNKEHCLKVGREYYLKNREKQCLYKKQNKERDRLKKNAYAREYLRRRKKTDHRWRALLTCKRRMWILFKSAGVKKNTRSAELMGIDRDGFYAHIESLWLPGMNWENRGFGRDKWHIHHVRPCASFDMRDPVQAKQCWHFTNLVPMWAPENWRKGDRWEPDGKVFDSLRGWVEP